MLRCLEVEEEDGIFKVERLVEMMMKLTVDKIIYIYIYIYIKVA